MYLKRSLNLNLNLMRSFLKIFLMEEEETLYISSDQLRVFDREFRDVLEEFNKYTDTPISTDSYKRFIENFIVLAYRNEWMGFQEVKSVGELVSDEEVADKLEQTISEDANDDISYTAISVNYSIEKLKYYRENAEKIYKNILSGNYLIDITDILHAVISAFWVPIFDIFDFDERIRNAIKARLKEKAETLPEPYKLIFTMMLIWFEEKEQSHIEDMEQEGTTED